jgi:prepilin-type N-terminal cleavage/methylation domain-containing protein
MKNLNRSGFTLIELLIVLSILVFLAALIVPKMTDVLDRTRSGTQAYSIADIDRHLNNYYALNHKYPEGWDLLLKADGTGSEPTTLYSKLATVLSGANGIISGPIALTDDQLASLKAAGVSHMFANDEANTDVNFSGTERHHLGTGSGHDGSANAQHALAINTASGSKGLTMLRDSFGLAANIDAGAEATRITNHTYVVFGLGFKNSMVQASIQDAPILENSVALTSYSRALCVFEIPNSGQEKALLVGVFGPDGRTKRESISDYNNSNGQQPH